MESDITPKEKERLDKIISGIISQKWEPESCMQEFYSEFFVSPHYGFYHNGHEYFITIDADENQKVIWVIYTEIYQMKKKNMKIAGMMSKEKNIPIYRHLLLTTNSKMTEEVLPITSAIIISRNICLCRNQLMTGW